MGASQVLERTFGPAIVGIGCSYIGCVQSAEINMSEQTRNLSCDRRKGKDGIFHYDPDLEVMLQASNFNMSNLAIALDTSGAGTWAGKETRTLETVSVTWTGSASAWSGSVVLNKEISGTVAWYSDSDGSTEWTQSESGTSTVIGPCLGQVTLTSSGTAEPTATLYATYAWGDQIPSGSSIVQPGLGSTANDRYVVICHKKAQENKVIVWRIWRMQVIRDFTISYDNESDSDITVPIHLTGLVDTMGHPSVPMFDVSEVDLANWTPSYEPYSDVVEQYPIT